MCLNCSLYGPNAQGNTCRSGALIHPMERPEKASSHTHQILLHSKIVMGKYEVL